MAAADVHRLKRRPGLAVDQSTFFYHNHPISFVSLVGIIVGRTDVPRRTILTLDDSSGATIEIAVLKAPDPVADTYGINGPTTTTHGGPPAKAQKQQRASHIAATPGTDLDISPLIPGAVVQVKGTLSMFRGTMQLQLERWAMVRDTNAEMLFLDQRSRYLVEVLSSPWRLSKEEIEQLEVDADEEEEKMEEEQARMRRRLRKRAEREEKDAQRIQKSWEREENIRSAEAIYCRDYGVKAMRDIKQKRARG
ncbi:hypothetical protein FE257_002539 [Aspergillus nanangensis]|uniref:CST complex subunit Stn1 N-terminal domain-containing protein n=1 Tax=Aspergillus nanangensis TaxID=2582783 RepID=A0AAD4CTG0_ASPNN|nr:hypothetical protein FE257_002539 [Aspergillus nanangensis]